MQKGTQKGTQNRLNKGLNSLATGAGDQQQTAPRVGTYGLGMALTFDDVLLVPAYSEVLPRDTILTTALTRNIELRIPLLSAAMDTVTEAPLAIAMAQVGGIGIIHKNWTPAEQGAEVQKVKRYETGILVDPITVSPDLTVREVIALTEKYRISGFPVVDGDFVRGIVTNRDLRFEDRLDAKVSEIMTPREKLITVREGSDLDQAQRLMHEHRLERVLIIDEQFRLRGLVTVKDILKSTQHPNACKDGAGKLRVGAAVGVGDDREERVEELVRAGVDVIVVDTAHGHSKGVLDSIRDIKRHYPELDVIGGNIATGEAAIALRDAGADGVKVGIGPGSICTTRVVAGVGVPQITAINAVSEGLRGTGIPVIADGGIRYSGDVAKAVAAGANSVMMGSMFAGTEEAPGEVILYQGRSYKSYRGMGSVAAMRDGAADRYFQDPEANADKLVPEGIEGRVPYKGSVTAIVYQLVGGLQASMGYCGCAGVDELREKAQFVQISSAGMRESHVHDVQIVKEAPNYQVT